MIRSADKHNSSFFFIKPNICLIKFYKLSIIVQLRLQTVANVLLSCIIICWYMPIYTNREINFLVYIYMHVRTCACIYAFIHPNVSITDANHRIDRYLGAADESCGHELALSKVTSYYPMVVPCSKICMQSFLLQVGVFPLTLLSYAFPRSEVGGNTLQPHLKELAFFDGPPINLPSPRPWHAAILKNCYLFESSMDVVKEVSHKNKACWAWIVTLITEFQGTKKVWLEENNHTASILKTEATAPLQSWYNSEGVQRNASFQVNKVRRCWGDQVVVRWWDTLFEALMNNDQHSLTPFLGQSLQRSWAGEASCLSIMHAAPTPHKTTTTWSIYAAHIQIPIMSNLKMTY